MLCSYVCMFQTYSKKKVQFKCKNSTCSATAPASPIGIRIRTVITVDSKNYSVFHQSNGRPFCIQAGTVAGSIQTKNETMPRSPDCFCEHYCSQTTPAYKAGSHIPTKCTPLIKTECGRPSVLSYS
jgi:hypothetical protein